MEIYENPACYEGARAIYEVGVSGEGCKGADTRQRRRKGAAGLRRPGSNSHLKSDRERAKSLLSSRNRVEIIIRHKHTPYARFTHKHTRVHGRTVQ